jgi:2-dehydro-3-deoxygluconokinase
MVELARGTDNRFGLAYGGDTFNTAVYMARCGVPVSYATALGDDPYSHGIRQLAADEGVGTELVLAAPGRMPGLYLIETASKGERMFHYWRDRSPARELFERPESDRIAAAMLGARLVYISGITLSLYSANGLDRLADALASARAAGARIAMDGNYRPRGWTGDVARARRVMERFWRLADMALPTLDDEVQLWGESGAAPVIDRLRALGVAEIVVKDGTRGAVVAADGTSAEVPIPSPVVAIDTTAAGDSFNAAYLASRLAGVSPAAATLGGHRLAGVVVQHRGAIVPRHATATVVVNYVG